MKALSRPRPTRSPPPGAGSEPEVIMPDMAMHEEVVEVPRSLWGRYLGLSSGYRLAILYCLTLVGALVLAMGLQVLFPR